MPEGAFLLPPNAHCDPCMPFSTNKYKHFFKKKPGPFGWNGGDGALALLVQGSGFSPQQQKQLLI